MENPEEYDIITQSIQIDRETVERIHIAGDVERLRKYILGELAVQMAKKLIDAGYITETWIRQEQYEQCTVTIYVKPLVN